VDTDISKYPELKQFMGDPTMHSRSLHRVQKIARKLNEKWKEEAALIAAKPVLNLADLLGGQNDTTLSISLYWSVMENTYRVLHGPTFWAKYRPFWTDRSSVSEAFIAIILLVVASVKCLSPNQPMTHVGLSSTGREEAKTIVKACEQWINRQSKKDTCIEHVQIRVLLYIAKRINCIHDARGWEEATALTTMGIQMGLHRDTNLIEKGCHGCTFTLNQGTSEYEKEMRRRLWATIRELELQAAFDRGVFSSSNALASDCGAASNIGDDDFGELSDQVLSLNSGEAYTSGSFLALSNRSFLLRAEVNRIINDPKINLSYDEMLQYHARMMEELETMPSWVDANRNTNNVPSSSTLPALLLDIQLRQYLLLLHLPFAQLADENSRYCYSRMVCLNGANNILDYHSKLAASGNYVLNLLRGDVFRSALVVCHSVISWNSSHGNYHPPLLCRYRTNDMNR
jgi:hypothetical protein